VIARVKAILRRVETTAPLTSKLNLEETSFRVTRGDRAIELTMVEFNLFKRLFNSPGRIYSREHLMSLIYSDDRVVTDRTIDSHIKKIRKKLQTLGLKEDPIHSVYGAGYRYE
jgi:two-component system, OmpR family, response regulator BaeR